MFKYILLLMSLMSAFYSTVIAQSNSVLVQRKKSEKAEMDVLKFKGFPNEISKQKPSKELPNRKIKSTEFYITNRIDTVSMARIYDSLSSPKAYIFLAKEHEFDQGVAIQREKDWVVISWVIFTQKAPAAYKMSWLKFSNFKNPLLLMSLDERENVASSSPFGGDYYKDNLVTSEFYKWEKASGLMLIEPTAISLLIDATLTGYEYSYVRYLGFRESNTSGGDYIYGTNYKVANNTNLWYDLNFNLDLHELTITLKDCSNRFIEDESISYAIDDINKEKGRVLKPKVKTLKNTTCRYILSEGRYKIVDGKFVLSEI